MNFWFFFVLYIVIALVVFGVALYKDDGSNDEGFLFMVAIFWPILLVILIAASPFIFVRMFALKLKKMKKLKRMNLYNLDKKC